jgi:hypothetical protein
VKADVLHLSTCYYIFIYAGKSVTLKSILKDIWNNIISFHGGKDTLRDLLLDVGFNFGKYDNR